jgi:amphi-Trp domain-containing protein
LTRRQRRSLVSDLELERKESLSRAEAAKRLSTFAEALAAGGKVELDLGGTSLSLHVADDVRMEFEVEVKGDEIEVEMELTWSTAPRAATRKA